MSAWYDDRFTGIFTQFVNVPLRAHDPDISICAAEMPSWFEGEVGLGCSGAGWTAEQAVAACLGEGIERLLARWLPDDRSVRSSVAKWSLDEPPIAPGGIVLFHEDQYRNNNFPLAPFTDEAVLRWVQCREVGTGRAIWAPEDLVFLVSRPGECQRLSHGYSTGLSCGVDADLVVLRGAQEVIERDALVGGWWGRYSVEEHSVETIRGALGEAFWRRVDRPNLTYRGYLIRSPFSDHVTMVSVSGDDDEGWVFSVGTACRETREASWRKSVLEAIQGRHCVRMLLGEQVTASEDTKIKGPPTTFFEHALHYTLQPEQLRATVLENADSPCKNNSAEDSENMNDLQRRLGLQHPILFRNLTPPPLIANHPEWVVMRVLIPGLQPLHGDHRFPFLGGPLWVPRPLDEWKSVPPHPFA